MSERASSLVGTLFALFKEFAHVCFVVGIVLFVVHLLIAVSIVSASHLSVWVWAATPVPLVLISIWAWYSLVLLICIVLATRVPTLICVATHHTLRLIRVLEVTSRIIILLLLRLLLLLTTKAHKLARSRSTRHSDCWCRKLEGSWHLLRLTASQTTSVCRITISYIDWPTIWLRGRTGHQTWSHSCRSWIGRSLSRTEVTTTALVNFCVTSWCTLCGVATGRSSVVVTSTGLVHASTTTATVLSSFVLVGIWLHTTSTTIECISSFSIVRLLIMRSITPQSGRATSRLIAIHGFTESSPRVLRCISNCIARTRHTRSCSSYISINIVLVSLMSTTAWTIKIIVLIATSITKASTAGVSTSSIIVVVRRTSTSTSKLLSWLASTTLQTWWNTTLSLGQHINWDRLSRFSQFRVSMCKMAIIAHRAIATIVEVPAALSFIFIVQLRLGWWVIVASHRSSCRLHRVVLVLICHCILLHLVLGHWI